MNPLSPSDFDLECLLARWEAIVDESMPGLVACANCGRMQ